ncbi:MAG: hypothetical protein AB8G05_04275 [Oligoflexales bacterium]
MRAQFFLCLTVCLNLTASCIASRGYTKVDYLEDRSLPGVSRKISINFSNLSVVRTEKGKEKSASIKPVVEGFMLSNSGYFLTIQSIQGEEDLFFRFKTVTLEKDLSFLAKAPKYLYLTASILSLTVIPFYDRTYRRLEVEVIQGGKLLKRYKYKDYYVRVSWFGMLPWWRVSDFGDFFYWETEASRSVDHNMVNRFLADFGKDFLPKQVKKQKTRTKTKTRN